MEIYTKILDIKNRVGKNSNKVYQVIETEDGNFNCHESVVVDEIRPFINGMCNLAIRETPKSDGNGVWRNVIGIVKDSDSNSEKPTTSGNMKTNSKPNNYTTMYVSYAKDIYVANSNNNISTELEMSPDMVMKEAIMLVKQAKEAFE